MKKIDKLILSSFLGPFILTFLVVVFILLTQHMLKYFDDIIGKDLGWDVVGTLLFYFAIFMTPVAMPLAVLLSSLITFGNLGEHFELTAVKSLGISLVRSLVPIFAVVIILTVIAFYANNYLVPKAALEAYSLLYDIKQKKPALDLREGMFYSSIPDISIKVNNKLPDGQSLKGIIIYDHRGRTGNKEVTIADSGKMYTILKNQYLKLELYNGYNYSEGTASGKDVSGRPITNQSLSKTKFEKSEIVFDLSSFGLNRTDKRWFQGNRIMRNLVELQHDMDSINKNIKDHQLNEFLTTRSQLFNYHLKRDSIELPKVLSEYRKHKDSTTVIEPSSRATLWRIPTVRIPDAKDTAAYQGLINRSDSVFDSRPTKGEISTALGTARMLKSKLLNNAGQTKAYALDYKIFQIQWNKILSNSLACIVMFLIGAPLGSIIKRGGLGVPVLTSILFFILFYLMSMMGEKWAKSGIIPVPVGIWAADVILFCVGLVFLRQARLDARLFDSDFYNVMIDRLKTWLKTVKLLTPAQS
jgi:lipopolysaccharide export system permease protein